MYFIRLPTRETAAIVVGLSLAWVTTPDVCFAQSAGNKAAAEAIFEQGKLLMQSGDYRQACPKFEASQKLDEGIGTLLYLADCYEKVGRTASAWAIFKEAASLAGAQSQVVRQRMAMQRARSLEPGLVKLTVEVAKGNESILGFEVSNDGASIPSAQYGAPIPVDPGSHRIQAGAPGKRTYAEVITVAQGAARITIPVLTDLANDEGGTSQPATSAPSNNHSRSTARSPPLSPISDTPASTNNLRERNGTSGSTQRVVSYVVGGLGLLGLGFGTYYGFAAIHDNSQSKNYCPTNPNLCTGEGVSLRNNALSEGRISTVAFIAGGAALAAGAVLFFTAPNGRTVPVAIQSIFKPGQARFSLGGNF
jgi:serine/threonine-protein kinase